MIELQQSGSAALSKHISESCSWVTEVCEYDVTYASGALNLNIFTSYGSSEGTSEKVKEELQSVLSSLEVFLNCIQEKKAGTCSFNSLKEPCTICRILQQSGSHVCCTSVKCLHISSDQAPSQRKAHVELNAVTSKDINHMHAISPVWLRLIALLQELLIISSPLQTY